jgi:hypothetical protein
MTVLVYMDASKQVGDPNHIKVFANAEAAANWFAGNDPEGVAFEYEVLDERLPTRGSAQSVIQRAGGERIWNSLHPSRRSWIGYWPARS